MSDDKKDGVWEADFIGNRAGGRIAGQAICLQCKHKWVANAPLGTLFFECPACGLIKGVFWAACAKLDKPMFQCNCGCHSFSLVLDGNERIAVCALCGTATPLEDFFNPPEIAKPAAEHHVNNLVHFPKEKKPPTDVDG